MSTAILDVPALQTTAQAARGNLASATEKLAALRFFILLTARREAVESVGPEAHDHVKSELVWLRSQYLDMIDQIAMHFSVQAAMDVKQEVERGVTVPRDWPSMDLDLDLDLGEMDPAWF